MYALFQEMYVYIRLRHEQYTTDEYKHSSRATTILVTGIPNELNNFEALKTLFGIFPDGVKRIWLNRDPSKLAKFTAKRVKLVANLEGAATNYIIQHAKDLSKSQQLESDAENGRGEPDTEHPHHRKLPIIGEKVDSLVTYRSDLINLNQQISELQKNPNSFKQLNSAFIQFNDYIGAQLAATITIPKLNNIHPKDVVWENLNFTSNQRMFRRVISLSVVAVLVSFWATAVTFVATIATLDELKKILPFLEGPIGKLPPKIVGIIQGILPPIALNVLMLLFSMVITSK
jgi:calcium permeable stress-gated cation channel